MKITIIVIALLLMLLGYLMQPKEAEAESQIDIKMYSAIKVLERWGGGQWGFFNTIVERESNWNPTAQNSKSTAYGLCQFLDSTWEGEKTSDPYKQIDECVTYIANRYETPQKAVKFHNKHNWY